MTKSTELMSCDSCFLIAPAGCGKTHLIAEMVATQDSGMQLVLTHTNAGVRSLSQRLSDMEVHASRYKLTTIAGWALRWANYYPKTVDFLKKQPDDPKCDYPRIYRGVAALLQYPHAMKAVTLSYSGVIVDEYQDCTKAQHRIITALAKIMPCRVLGDPLQAIFDFGNGSTLVEWDSDVRPYFKEIQPLKEPHRWRMRNETLGQWLIEARSNIECGQPIDLRRAPVNWAQQNESSTYKECMRLAKEDGTVVVIHPDNKNRNKCHTIAKVLRGAYQSIEEVEAKALQQWTYKFDIAQGNERSRHLIDFASDCCTKVSSKLRRIRKKFANDVDPVVTHIRKYKDIAELLVAVSKSDDFALHETVLLKIKSEIMDSVPKSYIYRLDLWYSMIAALRAFDQNMHESLRDAAWEARQRQKHTGRPEFSRIISRTLLIKGLEFDHAILLEANKFDSENLYVALTRASKSVTIISPSPMLEPSLNDNTR